MRSVKKGSVYYAEPFSFDDLPEPARTNAFEIFQQLCAEGSDRQEALKQAHDQASSWIAERAGTVSCTRHTDKVCASIAYAVPAI